MKPNPEKLPGLPQVSGSKAQKVWGVQGVQGFRVSEERKTRGGGGGPY